MILSAAMMLDWLADKHGLESAAEAGERIERAVDKAYAGDQADGVRRQQRHRGYRKAVLAELSKIKGDRQATVVIPAKAPCCGSGSIMASLDIHPARNCAKADDDRGSEGYGPVATSP